MKAHEIALAEAAARLASASPELWKRFLQTMETRAWMNAKACVETHPAAVHVAQGRAKEGFDLFEALEKCTKTAAEAAATQKGKTP